MSTNSGRATDGFERSGMSESAQMYLLFVLAVGCALVLCVVPRAVAPTELPALHLARAQVEAAIADDQRASKQAPRSETALELERLFLEEGQAEDRAIEPAEQHGDRRRQLHATYRQLVSEQGEPAALSLRSRAVDKLEAALELRLPQEQVAGVMGIFAYALQEYRATRAGEPVAPHFVVRTLYKARWNLMMGLAPDFAFRPIELLAHHGWLALHADGLDIPHRIQSLDRYVALGGSHAVEAHGVLLFLARQYDLAPLPLQVAYEKTRNLRVRNYAQGARLMAAATAEPRPGERPPPEP